MAALSPASAAAIARLRSYVPPPTTWYSLPLSRRAAVLILLFADKKGDLRVVLTMRSTTLKSYAGQAALPGGKSDTLAESPLQTARREAFEEIGLPQPTYPESDLHSDSTQESVLDKDPSVGVPASNLHSTKYNPPTPDLPKPFLLEHLCQLPTNLAKTELGVRPCVAFLSINANYAKTHPSAPVPEIETTLIPRLDAKEVAAVFSGPFHNFLLVRDEYNEGIRGDWYKGSWIDWHETKFRMHNFFVPVKGRAVTKPEPAQERAEKRMKEDESAQELQPGSTSQLSSTRTTRSMTRRVKSDGKIVYPQPSRILPYRDVPRRFGESNPDPLDSLERFKVFGMTARILVDCARVAYGEEPAFEHNSHFGDEAIIQRLLDVGKFEAERSKGDEFFGDDLKSALKLRGFGGLILDKRGAEKL